MREIKFRAWDNLSHNMSPNGTLADWIYQKPEFNIAHESNPYGTDNIVFMQFTGLTDKKGKELYEGDIVEIIDGSDKSNYQIRWQEELSRFGVDGLNPTLPKLVNEYDGCIVIGNIYENPDLIK